MRAMNMPSTSAKTVCPTPRGMTTLRDGTRRLIPCGRLVCPFCGPVTALRTISAIRLASPERAGYLSLPPSRLSTPELRASAPLLLRTAVGRIARDVRLTGKMWEHVSVVELSSSGRPHAHFLQRGDPLSPKELRHLAARHRAGWAGLSPIRHMSTITNYVLKRPVSALDMDADEATELLALHRELNGGRLVSATPGFWRDSRGEAVRGVTAARRAAYYAWVARRTQ